MRISIITFGKFHSFDLARELLSHKNNIQLYSSYPFFIAKKYNIPKTSYYSFFLLQIIDRITSRKLSKYIKIVFSFFISLIIKKDQHIYILWSSTPHFLIKKIKKLNKNSIIIIERGSTHIEFQNDIIKDEFERFNLKFKTSSYDISNELKNYKLADFISIPSGFVENSFLEKKVNKNKLILNPYGANLDIFYPSKEKKDKQFRIITTGTGSIRKGLFYVLESHKFIKGDFIHYHIGNIDNELGDIVKQYPKLVNIKSVNQSILSEYYRNSHLFILASLEEGLSLTIIEAMASGLPIIATKNSGIETIKSNLQFRTIVDIRDPFAIADKVNYFINNPDKVITFSINSRKTIQDFGLTWKDYGNRYIKNLRQKIN
tara:strand:+ start:21599 stop:22720 length:1122 start_codon:yes stop_codon:yes gene_type:complete